MADADLDRVGDTRWAPAVTLEVRLAGVNNGNPAMRLSIRWQSHLTSYFMCIYYGVHL